MDKTIRANMLRNLYRLFPFDLKADCVVPPATGGIVISCVINFYGRLDLLSGILHSLAQQDYSRELFEVVLVEDKGGTDAGRKMAREFSANLQISYVPLDRNFGRMGYSRNYALARTRGEIVLFLDDDTVILQSDFLAILEQSFTENPDSDAVIPHGLASYALVQDRYDFHDPYFMTSRCTAYRRSLLTELGGFCDNFIGQEDVEFVIRFSMADKQSVIAPQLSYYHPPLLVNGWRKPMAVGFSFWQMHRRYPVCVWLLALLNCCRHAPLFILPGRRNREMGRFGIGFFFGVVSGIVNRKGLNYN
jgi:GT2 family glycosyltransferase